MVMDMTDRISDETIEYVGILAKLDLNEEEKEQARQDAIDKLRDEEMAKMRRPKTTEKKATENNPQVAQPSLFDL